VPTPAPWPGVLVGALVTPPSPLVVVVAPADRPPPGLGDAVVDVEVAGAAP
jgi:hypothetical protein